MTGIGTILKFCQHLNVAINFERIVPDFLWFVQEQIENSLPVQ